MLWNNAGQYYRSATRRSDPNPNNDGSPSSVSSRSGISVSDDASPVSDDEEILREKTVAEPANSLTITRRCMFFGEHASPVSEQQPEQQNTPTFGVVPDFEAARNISDVSA